VHILYLVSVWLHILAATVWIGGMFFVVLVVVPWLRRGTDRAAGATFLRETGVQFRFVGWICFAILVVTGAFNLYARGVRLQDLVSADWYAAPFGKAFAVKLAAFLLVLAVSAIHDFVVGPRAVVALERDAAGADAQRYRRLASRLGRANALLALVLVAAGVMLVRGWPW
jgi:uncharacterized membrane protein